MLDNSWFVPIKTHPSNALRIFCFHYAGGSMSVYRTWSEHLKNADLVTIQLPGRENRFTEALITEMDLIIDNLYENFSDFDNKPYVFFGHSLGALIAFEFAKKLQKQGHLGLKNLIVSGSRAPHLPIRRRLIYNLHDQELFSEIQKYNGIPENLLAEKDLLMNIMLPIIRADFTISDIYISALLKQNLKFLLQFLVEEMMIHFLLKICSSGNYTLILLTTKALPEITSLSNHHFLKLLIVSILS